MLHQENCLKLIVSAYDFAACHHKHQRRKGFNSIPYINHPVKVVDFLVEVGKEYDCELLAAAVLHDVIEDTEATKEDILMKFGKEVLNLVLEVTDDMSLSSSERKAKQVEKAPFLSTNAKKIKIADKTCNMQDILQYSLPWTRKQKLNFFLWAEKVVNGCRGANKYMEEQFDTVLAKGKLKYSR